MHSGYHDAFKDPTSEAMHGVGFACASPSHRWRNCNRQTACPTPGNGYRLNPPSHAYHPMISLLDVWPLTFGWPLLWCSHASHVSDESLFFQCGSSGAQTCPPQHHKLHKVLFKELMNNVTVFSKDRQWDQRTNANPTSDLIIFLAITSHSTSPVEILWLEDDGVSVLDQFPLSRHINSTHPSGINKLHSGNFIDVSPPNLRHRRSCLVFSPSALSLYSKFRLYIKYFIYCYIQFYPLLVFSIFSFVSHFLKAVLLHTTSIINLKSLQIPHPAWLVMAKMLEPRRGICSISVRSCLTPIWQNQQISIKEISG